MVQYLIILLDDTSTSYCHYGNREEKQLMPLDTLKQGILYAMKENLMIQFVYPDYELPQEYKDAIDSIDHSDIVSSSCEDKALKESADVVVFNGWGDIDSCNLSDEAAYVIRTNKADLFEKQQVLKGLISKVARMNVVITDVETFTEEDFNQYKQLLASLS